MEKGSELPAQILEAIGYFSVEPVTIEDALSLLRQKRQENEDWQKLAEAKVIELKAALSSPQQEWIEIKEGCEMPARPEYRFWRSNGFADGRAMATFWEDQILNYFDEMERQLKAAVSKGMTK